MDQKEFWLLFTPLVAAIGDSHSSVVDPRFFIKNDRTEYFPIRAIYLDRRLIVDQSFADETIARGTVIKSVNGLTVDQILKKLRHYRYGTLREKDDSSAVWLWVGIPEVFGHPPNFVVGFGDGSRKTLRAIKLAEVIEREKAQRSVAGTSPIDPDAPPLELKFLPDNVAYLKSTTFAYHLEKYKELLTETFRKVREAGSKQLVIDVRANSGGNSALGDALTQMFTSLPYRHYSMKWRRSNQYVDEMDRKKIELPEEYRKLRAGEYLTVDSATISPGERPFRFSGKVYVLSSKATFSSGQMFLAVIKANRLATIVGEETNQPVCSTGEIFFFNLPNSHLRTSLSTKSFIPPGGCNGAAGVVPDVLVRPRFEDFLSGRDTILETALGLIEPDRALYKHYAER
jgi:hypothetical protein